MMHAMLPPLQAGGVIAAVIAASLLAAIFGRPLLTAIVRPSEHQALGAARGGRFAFGAYESRRKKLLEGLRWTDFP
jgi:hypothetical protein